MEDGLLVSHHGSVPNSQRIVTTLQVKVLKGQLYHLGNSKDVRMRRTKWLSWYEGLGGSTNMSIFSPPLPSLHFCIYSLSVSRSFSLSRTLSLSHSFSHFSFSHTSLSLSRVLSLSLSSVPLSLILWFSLSSRPQMIQQMEGGTAAAPVPNPLSDLSSPLTPPVTSDPPPSPYPRPSASPFISEDQFGCHCCYDVLVNPTTLNCGHSFCRHCLALWWESSRKTECPECREKWEGFPKVNILLR